MTKSEEMMMKRIEENKLLKKTKEVLEEMPAEKIEKMLMEKIKERLVEKIEERLEVEVEKALSSEEMLSSVYKKKINEINGTLNKKVEKRVKEVLELVSAEKRTDACGKNQ